MSEYYQRGSEYRHNIFRSEKMNEKEKTELVKKLSVKEFIDLKKQANFPGGKKDDKKD